MVWVRGEHDLATRDHLSAAMDEAARLDDGDIAVDLSGVTFLDASTIGVLVLARNHLRACSHSLSVRDPSPRTRWLLGQCGLEGMIDDARAPLRRSTAPALDSWVAVPVADRLTNAAETPPGGIEPPREPARTTVPRRAEPAEMVHQPRAPS